MRSASSSSDGQARRLGQHTGSAAARASYSTARIAAYYPEIVSLRPAGAKAQGEPERASSSERTCWSRASSRPRRRTGGYTEPPAA